jgi:hypothetical protein
MIHRKLIAFACSLLLTLCGIAVAQQQGIGWHFDMMRGSGNRSEAVYTPLWITPIMTGSNAPSGLVTASSSFSAARLPWFAMDGDIGIDNDCWTSAGSSFPNWLQYQSISRNAAKQVLLLTLAGNAPKDYAFAGSLDGASWTTLSSGTCTDVVTGIKQVYQFTNNTEAFYYYRLTSTNGYSSYTAIAEFDVSSGIDIPLMTSASNPSPFVITESSLSSTALAGWKAFDNTANGTTWQSQIGPITQQWVNVDFGSPKVADIVVIRNTLNFGFNNLSVSGSSDGTTYSVLMVTNAANTATPQRFALNNANAYRHYKVSTTNGYATNVVSVADIRLLYAP